MAATSTLPERMGGSERVIWEVARALTAHGHAVRILTPTADRQAEVSEVDGIGIARYRDPFLSFGTLYLPSLVLAGAAVRAAIAGWGADVVHAHQALPGLAAPVAALAYTFYGPWSMEFLSEATRRHDLSRAKAWTRALWVPAKAALVRRIERAALRRSRRVIVLSRFSSRQLAEIHGVTGERVTLIPGGVDVRRFRPAADRRDVRDSLGLSGDGPLLFTVRRLVPRMGIELLLRALATLPGVRLVVGGQGWLRSELEETAASLGVGDRVRFVGLISDADLVRYYQATDLVVLPSVALEGFGLVTLEALACGTPIVATPVGGAVDVLAGLEPGWLARAATPEALAEALASALDTAAGRADVAARCRTHATRYAWEGIATRYEAVYAALRS